MASQKFCVGIYEGMVSRPCWAMMARVASRSEIKKIKTVGGFSRIRGSRFAGWRIVQS